MKILGVIGIIGAIVMIFAGVDMMRIMSQATSMGEGPSIAEVFYNAVGLGFIGLGIFGLMLMSVLTLGLLSFKEVQAAEEEEEE